ncbi:MAG: alpha/beta fold hydrolase [Acidobacteria bacterium]|nr:alpha/beta fold hydrolase [Acidobacteriota bacterium]
MRRTIRPSAWILVAAIAAVTGGASTGLAAAKIDWEKIDFVANDGTSVRADFGKLEVPERRADPDTESIQLAMVRFRSTADQPGAPIVFLANGPGVAGVEFARGNAFAAFTRLREVADVIVLDQRGVGLSQPNLTCSQRLKIGAGKELTTEAYIAAFRKPLRDCVRTWQTRGVDVGGYTAAESADDIEAIRDALGVDQINLWGHGFGTHLAIAVMRRHPGSVARAALHGVWGPDDTQKLPKSIYTSLRQFGRLVGKDAVVGGDVPDLVGSMERITRQLERSPVRVMANDPFTGKARQVVVDAFLMAAIAAQLVGETEDYPFVPQVVAGIERGGFDAVIGEAALEVRGETIGNLVTWTMLCASGTSDRRARTIARQADDFFTARLADTPFPDVCDEIPVDDLGQDFRSRLRSPVPTLLVSGTLDGQTPSSNAKALAKGLAESTDLKVVRGGHNDLLDADPAIAGAVANFFRGTPLGLRKINLPPIPFLPVS